MSAPPTLTVLSLGGGVQSSVMALMAGEGAFGRVPDCAIFADTHWDTVESDRHIRAADCGVCNDPIHALSPASSVDSRRRSWYFFATTPISSAVGSRPSNRAVSVFVWE